jgi:hypothetical protein
MPIDCPGYEDRRTFVFADTPADWDKEADAVTKSYNDWAKQQSCKDGCVKSTLVINRGPERAKYNGKDVWAREVFARVVCHHPGYRLNIDDFQVTPPWEKSQ